MTALDAFDILSDLALGHYELGVSSIHLRSGEGQTIALHSAARWREIRDAWTPLPPPSNGKGMRGINLVEAARRAGKDHTTILSAISRGHIQLGQGGIDPDSLARYIAVCSMTRSGRYSPAKARGIA